MKKIYFLYITILISLLQSCATPQYFFDESSKKRQKELRQSRSGNVVGDIFVGIGSVFVGAMLETEIDIYPTDQEFKKLNLINPTTDTMYVNMLTDVYWDEENYCDFMDIRIPPKLNCKVMVPVNANYNLYFSNTPESDDDEMLEIFTTEIKRISLTPGITAVQDTTKN